MDRSTKEAPLVYTLSVFPSKKVLKSYVRSISEIAGITPLPDLWYVGDSTIAFLYPAWASLLDPSNWAVQQAMGHATNYGPPGLSG